MDDLFFGITEAAELLGRNPRRLQIRAKDEGWQGVKVPGKSWVRYPLSQFPEDWQRGLLEKVGGDQSAVAPTSVPVVVGGAHPTAPTSVPVVVGGAHPTPNPGAVRGCPVGVTMMELRAEMLGAFEIYVAECVAAGGKAPQCWERFVEDYNAGRIPNLSEALLAKYPPGRCPSRGSLTSWRTKRKNGSVLALQDHYKPRVGRIRGDATVRAAVDAAISYHGVAASPKAVWNVLQKTAELPEVRAVSVHQVQRYFEYLQDKEPAYWKQLTDPKGARNSVTPAFGNRSQELEPNDVWELDFTRNDVVLNWQGTRKRYAQGAVIDVATRRVMMLVSDVPKGEATALLILQAIQKFGKPKIIKPDNGKEFINTRVKALCAALEVELRPCVPGKPMEKPHIERFFGTFNRDVLPSLPSFVGASVAQRQAIREQKGEEQLFELAMEFGQFQGWVDGWIKDYHARPHGSLGCSPLEKLAAFTAGGWRKTVVDAKPETLALLALPRKVCTIGREGIRLNNRLYIDVALAEGIGERRMVLFDPTLPECVWVFSEDLKEFICKAQWDSTFTAEELVKVAAQAGAMARAATEGVKAARKGAKRLTQKVQKNPEILLGGAEVLGLERVGEVFVNEVTAALESAAIAQPDVPQPQQPRNEVRRQQVNRQIAQDQAEAAAEAEAFEVGMPTEGEFAALLRKKFSLLSGVEQARYVRYCEAHGEALASIDVPRILDLPESLRGGIPRAKQKELLAWVEEMRPHLRQQVVEWFPGLQETVESIDLTGF